jgi:hypothetical protein
MIYLCLANKFQLKVWMNSRTRGMNYEQCLYETRKSPFAAVRLLSKIDALLAATTVLNGMKK